MNSNDEKSQGYAPVNGLKMYYEIAGSGSPLVYLSPAFGCTGMESFPTLLENYSVISFDFQGHGRTADIPERPITLQQNVQDVVALLELLRISQADFFGSSYGGVIAAMVAVQHPYLVRRAATYGATFGPPEAALNKDMLRMDTPPTPDSPCFQFQRESYQKVAPDPGYWPRFWHKVVSIQWTGFSNEELAKIKAPLLIALGDHDFVRLDHAFSAFQLIPNAELAVIPDAGHFALFSEPDRVIPIVHHFLQKPVTQAPVATAQRGFYPGKTR